MAIKKLVRRVSKLIYFTMLLFVTGHILPAPEAYINYTAASRLALIILDDENAESMYDAYSYIDWAIMLFIVITFYILTMKLINKTRSK